MAAKWQLRDQVREIYEKIEQKSHEITEDWTRHKIIKPYDENKEISRRYSIQDINGVRNADVFVLLTNEDGIGMYLELGVAMMSYIQNRKPKIYVVGNRLGRSMHFFHPSVKRMNTIDDVFEDLGI